MKRSSVSSIITSLPFWRCGNEPNKKAISDAFWQLLEERPYNKITLQNIVEYCQVNRNTFYYHFQDIPALTEYSIQEWTEEIIKNHCEFGAPIQCITLITQECIRRKTAFVYLYSSSHREEFMRWGCFFDFLYELRKIPEGKQAHGGGFLFRYFHIFYSWIVKMLRKL